MGRESTVSNVRTFRIEVPPGATMFAYFDGQTVGGIGMLLKYVSGGSLFFYGSTIVAGHLVPGTSLAAASAATLAATAWHVNELISFAGSPSLYLTATGATAIASIAIGTTPGT